MSKDLPNPDLLRQVLRYEPETGKLYWKERSVDMFTDGKQTAEHNCASWNNRFANKEAFTAFDSYGYKHGKIFGRKHKAHRVIWAIVHDEWPDNIDHINGICDDNRIENLRSVSHAENLRNQKRPSTNTSGVVGVHWANREKKWNAYISIDRCRKSLGYFTYFDEAVAARKKAEIKHGFHHNHGRD